ncbi:predicted protein [Phaeodactylum tricornutum CCAP 1055/1]|uniref:RRM domain-containing protein n=1 Tax=Phaeodactylum tricornutum (strain CCAP 1055/1) TaxID=556484 RepID=B7G0X4_PHATC|nr:predicted protein [Phaeodactylum tricornutum CCAP 1055/1]EEC47402.1 predicted protein [Phaeodactylum tricornutum CCAP 1055/1]|eukprot:XP_002180750.1 predicted protein [Phaeodactylum tricornutum CCAP 1055/1]
MPPSSKARLPTQEALPAGTTRVCLKNLPPSFSSHDLRTFVRERLLPLDPHVKLTDCRVLLKKDGKSRRMGFCGFATPSTAQVCVRQLDKAYCRTNKLVVEFATLPASLATTTANDPTPAVESFKQEKSSEPIITDKDRKLEKKKEEFLAVMGVGSNAESKNKFWANDDGHSGTNTSGDQIATKATTGNHDDSESDSDSDDATDEDNADPLERKLPLPATEEKSSSAQTSDLDFLKSKKVQVQDLDDAETDRMNEGPHDDSESGSSSSNSSEDCDIVTQSKEAPKGQPQIQAGYTTENNDSVGDHHLLAGEDDAEAKNIAANRLFLRNLPFTATEDDLKTHFEAFGSIVECHVPADDQKRSKGFAFVTFVKANDAIAAKTALDGTDFQGRLLHVLPARQAPSLGDGNGTNLTFKEKQERLRKQQAESQTGWSASFVRGDAVVDNLASRLGLQKGEILAVKDGLSSGDAAVRLALGETAVIEENRDYFRLHNIDMDVLVSATSDKDAKLVERSKTMILVKNLPHDTTKEDLVKVFSGAGDTPSRILLPPSRTIAVVEYSHPNDAKRSFRKLAYRRFKNVPLYLEWAPLASKRIDNGSEETNDENIIQIENSEDANRETDDLVEGPTPTIYVKNLNFHTTEDQLRQVFSKHVKDVRTVRIPKKIAPVKQMSMGFGFVEFGSNESARTVLNKLQGFTVDGHILELKPSSKTGNQGVSSTAAKNTTSKSTKVMVRNVPFQATRKELLQLFGSFGPLKKVRLPKKFDGSHRGFAFVEYMAAKEAAAAMHTLSATHLYGRHLVLEWAAADEEAENLDILRAKAKRNIGLDALSARMENKRIRFE